MEIAQLNFDDRDEFLRKSIADKVISLLTSDINISPMVIDGSWGTGKTEFCHKLINLMNKNGSHHLIYIDAFKADHANEPLMTVLAEVIKVLPEGDKSNFLERALPALRFTLRTVGKATVSHVLRQDSADILEGFKEEVQETANAAIDATVRALIKDHIKAEKNLKALQAALKEIAEIKPIVLFVDELDRCRPDFAIDMLEIIKHTFDVTGVSFVLITNTHQLKASINHCYGLAVDAQRYLDKFLKFTITLPETVNTGSHQESVAALEHYKVLVSHSALLKELKLFECGTLRIIERIIKVNNLSLREIETFVRHIEIYVTLAERCYLKSNTVFGFKTFTIMTIIIYCIRPELAKSIINKKLDCKQLGDVLGVSTLSSAEEGYDHADEVELICYLLGRSAFKNGDMFTPNEKESNFWEQEAKVLFRGGHLTSRDNYSRICGEVIQVISMC